MSLTRISFRQPSVLPLFSFDLLKYLSYLHTVGLTRDCPSWHCAWVIHGSVPKVVPVHTHFVTQGISRLVLLRILGLKVGMGLFYRYLRSVISHTETIAFRILREPVRVMVHSYTQTKTRWLLRQVGPTTFIASPSWRSRGPGCHACTHNSMYSNDHGIKADVPSEIYSFSCV